MIIYLKIVWLLCKFTPYCLQRYSGRSSWMGQLVAELRKVYVTAKAEATPILEDILGEGSLQSLDRETTETEAVGESRHQIFFLIFH